ncbi:MAG: radical SAM family heme chaperone HemW, partial [Acetatifactor sp.]|nr:radical SAM family heme chaperone HemW [Acetatifactor sp.]
MKNLEIYMHIPFCIRKCGYCDFLSAPAGRDMQEKYVQALEREIRGRAGEYENYQVPTVFIGGGTPSILGPGQIKRLLDALRSHYQVLPEAEITMEANPGTVDYDSLAEYSKAGVDRLSLGLQSFWDEELRALGRIHTWQQFLDAYEAAVAAGFSHINVDLMSGLPGQTPVSYETTLRRVTELRPEPEHISAYSLILEEGTDFAARFEAGKLRLPDEETERALYGLTERILQEYGYRRYEISNYAKAGCECRHNVGYWTRENYLGFGIGAASLMENVRFQNGKDLQAYLEAPLEQREQEQRLTVAEQMEEYMFLGLRLTEGVSEGKFYDTFHY